MNRCIFGRRTRRPSAAMPDVLLSQRLLSALIPVTLASLSKRDIELTGT